MSYTSNPTSLPVQASDKSLLTNSSVEIRLGTLARLQGDVKVVIANSWGKVASFWFNTTFLQDQGRLLLWKKGLDGPVKDKKHKVYPSSFSGEGTCSIPVPCLGFLYFLKLSLPFCWTAVEVLFQRADGRLGRNVTMIPAQPISDEDRPVLVAASPASDSAPHPHDSEVIIQSASIPLVLPSETEDSETDGSEHDHDVATPKPKRSSGLVNTATIADASDSGSDSDGSNSVASAPTDTSLSSTAVVPEAVLPTSVPQPPPVPAQRQQAALMEQVTVQAMSALRVSMTSFAVDGISESMDIIDEIASAPLTLPVHRS